MNSTVRVIVLVAITVSLVTLSPSRAPGELALSPIFGVAIPPDYRHWELVGVAHETGFDELRGIVGNATTIEAYRAGTLPFPDGSILVKLAWKHVQSTEFKPRSFPGPPRRSRSWLRTRSDIRQPEAGVLVASSMVGRSTRLNTKLVSVATPPGSKATTSSSRDWRLETRKPRATILRRRSFPMPQKA
jgi:Cytochrome P460